MKFFLTIAMMVFASSAMAEEYSFESSGLPLTQAGLRAYALTKVNEAEFIVHSSSMESPAGEQYSISFSEPKSSLEWMNVVSSASMKVSISNSRPEEELLWFRVALRDRYTGERYFSAGAGQRPVKEGNQWVLPRVHLTFYLHGMIPIPIEGAVDAEIRLRDENGEINEYIPIYNKNGMFYFPSYLAGSRGELILTDKNGQRKFFSLEDGSSVDVTEVYISAYSASINGVIYLGHPMHLADVSFKTTNGEGTLPVIEVKACEGEERYWPTVVYTTEGHLPVGFVVQHRDPLTDEMVSEEYKVIDGEVTMIKIHRGLNYVVPVWGEEVRDWNTHIPEGDTYGGGKG